MRSLLIIIFARLVLEAMSFIIVFGVGHWKAFRTPEGLEPDGVMLARDPCGCLVVDSG